MCNKFDINKEREETEIKCCSVVYWSIFLKLLWKLFERENEEDLVSWAFEKGR
jgi:hypothetical protein